MKTLGKMKDKIPEWTMPEEFIEKQMEIEEEPETPSDALVENTYLSAQTEEEQLSNLLNRLDMAEPIKRMNESAQEDMADVIERDEEKVELSEALPLKPSKSTLPKYQKPKFVLIFSRLVFLWMTSIQISVNMMKFQQSMI